ncbi:NAD(P)H-dependent glycerol-3-phosphate dehydrogenase [Desulfovibrio aminophilus]|uniref:NAD(P)H-dependent glycerol-3-phosphate dehydrogenase n=1 Tax=Desulfovibrio aminophilus TaxID=81425 RepID=UPI00042177D3|nr:NAD(P)H-dependent glycerol-3-phosphate dehydrogenase [Desulfovibrio aminophilus]
MRIAVLGAGAWGTTLADMLCRKGLPVRLWAREEDVVRAVNEDHENPSFLPGVKLCPELTAHGDPAAALQGAEAVLVVIPSQFLRRSLESLRGHLPERPVIVCASKGIEMDTLEPMSVVVKEALAGLSPRYAVLSGPSFAFEVARGMPTSVTLGCADRELGRELREAFSTPSFRVYTSTDYRGVELGGAVKNVMAIAAGIADGLGFGHDARAALITRGLAEMSRLGVAMGARAKTFMGLSGMGDLVLTCTGDLSRNRQVGLKLGQGMKLSEIMAGTRTVAEGVKTTEAMHALAKKLGVELPITEQVHRILHEDRPPAQAVKELMTRSLKDEHEEEE